VIVDCIMYSYEPAALAVRMEELKDIVDVHIIVEGDLTFRGNPRVPIRPTGDKIRSFVINLPVGEDVNPWHRETLQRNASAQIARETFGKGNFLIIADADEIPHPEAIEAAASLGRGKLLTDYREWYANWRAPDEWQLYHQPMLVKSSTLDRGHTAQSLRENSGAAEATGPVGWHLSTLGNAKLAAEKLASFSHSEYDLDEWKEQQAVIARIESKTDILERFILEETENLPSCISKFPELVKSSTTNN
jgi:hypothetical protein